MLTWKLPPATNEILFVNVVADIRCLRWARVKFPGTKDAIFRPVPQPDVVCNQIGQIQQNLRCAAFNISNC